MTAETADALHVCSVVWESATAPTYSGAITVTQWCDCGAVVGVVQDWIV